MDSNYFESALNSLSRTQHKRRLLQVLMVIRKGTTGTQQIANVNKLQRNGSLKYLIGCLNSDSSNIVDITLSILGNIFCISSNCCRDAIEKYQILSQLCDILEKYDVDSIRGRLFRIIGNLNKHVIFSCRILRLEPNLIKKIIVFLQNISIDDNNRCNTSEATITMSIRSLRKFISNDTISTFIHEYDALKVVGQVLVKYTSEWEKNKANQVIIEDVLRLLLVFSKYKYGDSVNKLKKAETGDPLLCLSKLVVSYPTRVLKIIFNFASCVLVKTDIPIQNIAEKLVTEMKNFDIKSGVKDEILFKEYLKALCDLLEYPVYRIETKQAGGFSLLLNLLDNLSLPTNFNLECCHLILSTCIACRYDETIMNNHNCSKIVKLVTEKLKWIFGDTRNINTRHLYNSYYNKSFLKTNCGRKMKNIIHGEKKRIKKDILIEHVSRSDDSSPERSSSPCSSSDISSNPNSPNFLVNIADEELSDSDNYSPICSDNDESEPLPPQADESAMSDQEEIYKKSEFTFNVYKSSIEDEIQTLLKWCLKLNPPVMEIANEQLLILLINGALTVPYINGKTFDLIVKIFCIQEYLIPILLTDIIPVLYDLKLHIHEGTCYHCAHYSDKAVELLTQITILAESPSGKGDIAHQLFRADINTKQNLILKLPYVIRNRSILGKLMLNCGGLNILLKLLVDGSIFQSKSIKVLYILALQLRIKHAVTCDLKLTKPIFNIHKFELLDECVNKVTFKLDDGEIVLANRNFLSDQSEYFNILLSGNFKESHEKEIELHNVSSKSLQYLFNLLKHNVTQQNNYCLDLNLELDILLDIIALADQYLILELASYLASLVEQLYFTSKNVSVIYKWSIESGTNILRLEAMAYALAGNVVDSERLQIFEKFFSLGLSEYIIEDIKTLLIRFLK